MIDRPDEYGRMFAVETQLWWYRHLHESVIRRIKNRFGPATNLTILDVGCGTGGLLHRLREAGYTQLRGLDGSAEAVAFCRRRGLAVQQLDLRHLTAHPAALVDVLICNDVFCYFHDPDLLPLLAALRNRLKPGGLLISNNNAFAVFWGQHDLAVGSLRRFVRADFDRLASATGWYVLGHTYWSVLLAPLILAARQGQALALRLGWRSAAQAGSDVYLPHPLLNQLFYSVVRAEARWVRRSPFGSSLLLELVPA